MSLLHRPPSHPEQMGNWNIEELSELKEIESLCARLTDLVDDNLIGVDLITYWML